MHLEWKVLPGYLLLVMGFAAMIANALNYVLSWRLDTLPTGMGVIFVFVGLVWIRKARG